MPELKTWLQSSQDPTQVSNTVKGVILSLSSIIVFVAAQVFHITLTADNILALATEVGSLAGILWMLYGLIMKVTVKVGSVQK